MFVYKVVKEKFYNVGIQTNFDNNYRKKLVVKK